MNYQQNHFLTMHKYYLIYFLVSLCLSTGAFAQDADITRINSNYLRVKETQAQEKHYVCEFRYQPGTLKFPNVIEYQRQENFYYLIKENNQLQLEMAVLQIDSGKIHYDIELVYDTEGNLIFCQESQNNPTFRYNHIRIYFKEDKLLRLMEGNAIITSSLVFHQEKIEFVQKTAKSLYKKFMDYAKSLRMKP